MLSNHRVDVLWGLVVGVDTTLTWLLAEECNKLCVVLFLPHHCRQNDLICQKLIFAAGKVDLGCRCVTMLVFVPNASFNFYLGKIAPVAV